jgi:TonB family protein
MRTLIRCRGGNPVSLIGDQSLPLPGVNEVPPEVSGVNSAANSRRHFVSLAASILAHAALVALILYSAPRLRGGHDWVLAYLVEVGPGNGGTAGGAKGLPAIKIEPASIPETPIRSALSGDAVASKLLNIDVRDEIRTLPRPGVMASLSAGGLRPFGRKSAERGPSSQHRGSASAGGSGQGSGSGDTIGDGVGGAGIRIAHADYGANPAPMYPARSRQRAEQGTVTLHVLVAIDGSVERIEIAESSGFDDLDRSALDTVRKRWRFVPAKRSDGHPVESWVLVPIRFALR